MKETGIRRMKIILIWTGLYLLMTGYWYLVWKLLDVATGVVNYILYCDKSEGTKAFEVLRALLRYDNYHGYISAIVLVFLLGIVLYGIKLEFQGQNVSKLLICFFVLFAMTALLLLCVTILLAPFGCCYL